MDNKLTVVMYHYVRDFQRSKYPNIKGLDVRGFNEQVIYLQKYYNIISIEDVINSIDNNEKLPKKSVILTFDDGYKDHYDYVMPILDKHNIKGGFYIPAKTVEENKVLDVNKIHFILATQTDSLKIIEYLKTKLNEYKNEYNLKEFEYYYSKLAIANRFDNKDIIFIKRLLQVELEESLRNKITDELFMQTLNMSQEEFSKELYMDKEQIKEMITNGMHIGCHGYEHYWWNHLSNDELDKDLDKSLKFLSQLGVDMDNWTACYPYGSFSYEAVEILKKKKCKLAFTTEVNVADIDKDDRLLLPRLDTNDLPKYSNNVINEWYKKG